jgi:hypothetical protein
VAQLEWCIHPPIPIARYAGADSRQPKRRLAVARDAGPDFRQLDQELLPKVAGARWYEQLFLHALKRTGIVVEALDLLDHVFREYPTRDSAGQKAQHKQPVPVARYAAPLPVARYVTPLPAAHYATPLVVARYGPKLGVPGLQGVGKEDVTPPSLPPELARIQQQVPPEWGRMARQMLQGNNPVAPPSPQEVAERRRYIVNKQVQLRHHFETGQAVSGMPVNPHSPVALFEPPRAAQARLLPGAGRRPLGFGPDQRRRGTAPGSMCPK